MTELIRLMEEEGWVLSVMYQRETETYLAVLQSPASDALKYMAQNISIAAAMSTLDCVVEGARWSRSEGSTCTS